MTAGLALSTRSVHEVEVGGVRTLWAPAEGMVFARLRFRVGQADERLPIRGITHLVEHLAFERLGQPTYSFNGSVSMESTCFDVAGTQEEVADFLRVITAGLHDPPAERLAAERHLLKVESQQRGGVFAELASVRHGARGEGLCAYLELGLEHLEAEDLRRWAATWFTADNAVLWVWGGDAQQLDLRLPRGQWSPLPAVAQRPMAPRSWIPWGESGAALTFSAATDRGTANATAWWLQRHLAKALRHDAGLAYGVHVEQRQVGEHRLFSVAVDGAPNRNAELRDALLAALEALETVEVPEAEIAAWRRETQEMLLSTDRSAELGRLDLAATGILLSGEAIRPERVVEECAAVDAEAVAAAVRCWHQTCLLAIACDVEMPSTWHLVPRHSQEAVQNAQVYVPAVRALEGNRLLVGPDGVTAESPNGLCWTVRWDRCAAVLQHADGSLTAIGADGVTFQLLPDDWVGGRQLVSELARRLDPALVVPMDSKPTESVTKGLHGVAAVSTGPLVTLVAVLWLSTAILAGAVGDPVNGTAAAAFFGVFAAVSVWITAGLVVRMRAPKARRALPREPLPGWSWSRNWLARQEPSTLLALEIAAWTATVLVVGLCLALPKPPYVAIPFVLGSLNLRRERHRVAARRAV